MLSHPRWLTSRTLNKGDNEVPVLMRSLLGFYPLLPKALLPSAPSQDPSSKIHSLLFPHPSCLISHRGLEILCPWCLTSPSSPPMLTAHVLGQVFTFPTSLRNTSLHHSQKDLSKVHTLHIG
ncbi:hypothetical protein HJG60_011892 [Phyllostomus discolor]|uniref:Uncharacterized protein n=1 Tax=Phyllostomus discolor TaxID=89673 RepID=A0A833ZIV3_9CHIR|nr:hypothetical protein HJG60_011892 [Phyllostomus discolor]